MATEESKKLTGTISYDDRTGNTLDVEFLELIEYDVEILANDVLLNGRDLNTERFVPINSTPQMPIISINNNLNELIKGRLKIEYTKNYNGEIIRKWINHYPEESGDVVQTVTINANSSSNIDFGDQIRGGTAIFEYVTGDNEWNDENIETFTFYLRCENPGRDEVINYIENENYDDDYWFLIRLIRHESATGNSDEFRQFNIGTYTTTNSAGLPNFGPPRGFGLGQIDNFGRLNQTERIQLGVNNLEAGETMIDDTGRTIDWRGYIVASDNQVWNWQENIDTIIRFLDLKRVFILNRYTQWVNTANNWNNLHPEDLVIHHDDQVEGGITFSSVESDLEGVPNSVNDYFNDNDDINTKSFIDACLIRYYNGGYYHKLISRNNQKPYWEIDRDSEQSGFYVEHICSQNE